MPIGRVSFLTALTGTLEGADADLGADLRDAAGLNDGALSNLVTATATASRAIVSDSNGKLGVSAATATEVGYLSGVTSAIQTQINGKEPTITAGTSAQLWQGDKTWVAKTDLPISTATQTALDLKSAKASNLSDLANTVTARGNLGISRYFVADVGLTAAAFTSQLAASDAVYAQAEAYTIAAGVTVASGKTLIMEPGVTLSGASVNSMALSAGGCVEMHNGGSDGLTRYFGKKLTGTITPGAGPFESFTSGYMFDVRSDDRDVGTDFSVGSRFRHIFGGGSVKGGRIGLYSQLSLDGATHSANANRNYVAHQASAYAETGDGGTDTGAGAKGALFGGGLAAYLTADATNLLHATGVEINTFTETGASVRYLTGATIASNNEVRGADLDAFLALTGQSVNGDYGPHIGSKHGIIFSDFGGADPFYASSILIGSYWTGGGTKAVTTGIDLSGFTFSDSIIKGVGMKLKENRLDLVNTGTVSLVASGTGDAAITSRGHIMLAMSGVSGGDKSLSLVGQAAGAYPYWVTGGGDFTIRAAGGTLDVDFPTSATAGAASDFITIKVNGTSRKVQTYATS